MSLMLRYLNDYLISYISILTFNALTFFINFVMLKNYNI